jgi:hypothetical protein
MAAQGFLPQFAASALSETPVKEKEAFLSPIAGGYVTAEESSRFHDCFRAPAEVLLGLAKMAELAAPPANLRHAEASVVALFPFWRNIAEMQLPANESVVNELRYRG